jgi:hypothetical protein
VALYDVWRELSGIQPAAKVLRFRPPG